MKINPFSKTFHVYLADFGIPVQCQKNKGFDGRKTIAIRYDEAGEMWCKKHNCRLSLCKDNH